MTESSFRNSLEIFAVLTVSAVIRLLFAWGTAPGAGPDEYLWLAYARYIAEHWNLPIVDPAAYETYEFVHPPLFPALEALFIRTFGISDLASPSLWLRFPSVVFGLSSVFLTYKVSSFAFGGDRLKTLMATTLVAFLPTHVFVGSVVNSDPLLWALGTLSLYCFVTLQRKREARRLLACGLVLGMATLTKLQSLALYVAYLAVLSVQLSGRWRQLAKTCATLYIPAVGISLPWFIRNVLVYDRLVPLWPCCYVPLTRDWLTFGNVFIIRYAFTTFWMHVAGRDLLGPLKYAFFVFAAGMTLIAVWGAATGLRNRSEWPDQVGVLFVFVTLAVFAIMYYFGVIMAQGQGRQTFMAIAPISCLLVAGFTRIFPMGERTATLALLPAAFMLVIDILLLVIQFIYAPIHF